MVYTLFFKSQINFFEAPCSYCRDDFKLNCSPNFSCFASIFCNFLKSYVHCAVPKIFDRGTFENRARSTDVY